MTYSENFANAKAKLMGKDVSDVKEHLAYQINLTGEGSGVFYIEVKEGKLYVEPYEYYDRDAMFTGSAEVLNDIIDGKVDPFEAFDLGDLKVEGDIEKALKFSELIIKK